MNDGAFACAGGEQAMKYALMFANEASAIQASDLCDAQEPQPVLLTLPTEWADVEILSANQNVWTVGSEREWFLRIKGERIIVGTHHVDDDQHFRRLKSWTDAIQSAINERPAMLAKLAEQEAEIARLRERRLGATRSHAEVEAILTRVEALLEPETWTGAGDLVVFVELLTAALKGEA